MLEGGNHQHPGVVGKNVFRPVAMVNIEIDDGHTIQGSRFQCVRRADGHVIEQAKPHRTPATGVMTRGSHVAKRVPDLSIHHHVDCLDHRARGMQRRRQRMRVHRRVRVEMNEAGTRRHAGDEIYMALIVHTRQLLARRNGRGNVDELSHQSRLAQVGFDRGQPRRAFRMLAAHVMQQTVGMMNKSCRHAWEGKRRCARDDLMHLRAQCPRFANRPASTTLQ